MRSCVAISTTTAFRVVWVTEMLLVVGGCQATHPVADADAHPPPPAQILAPEYLEATPGTGVVSVTRDAGSEGSACTVQVRLSGMPVAMLRPSERVVLHLQPGKHILSTTEAESSGAPCGPHAPTYAEMHTVQVTASPERPVRVRIGFDSTGRLSLTATN
jgi:hypothetical protein